MLIKSNRAIGISYHDKRAIDGRGEKVMHSLCHKILSENVHIKGLKNENENTIDIRSNIDVNLLIFSIQLLQMNFHDDH